MVAGGVGGQARWVPDFSVFGGLGAQCGVRVDADSDACLLHSLALARHRAGDGGEVAVVGGDPGLVVGGGCGGDEVCEEAGARPQIDAGGYLPVGEHI